MNRRKLFYRTASLLLFIFFVNSAALYFHWYSSIWWFDMLMHFLGGLWLALMALWFFAPTFPNTVNIVKITSSVLFIAFFWEIFEIFVNDRIAKDFFDYQDMFSDLCFGLSGGLLGMLYFFFRIIKIEKDEL